MNRALETFNLALPVCHDLKELKPTGITWVPHILLFIVPRQMVSLGDPSRRSCDACESFGAMVKKIIKHATCRRRIGQVCDCPLCPRLPRTHAYLALVSLPARVPLCLRSTVNSRDVPPGRDLSILARRLQLAQAHAAGNKHLKWDTYSRLSLVCVCGSRCAMARPTPITSSGRTGCWCHWGRQVLPSPLN